jgi:hypothetical protein
MTRGENVTVNEVERFSIISSNPFEIIMARLKAAVGQPDIDEFMKTIRDARTFAELERAVHIGLGGKGMMIFMELDRVKFCAERQDSIRQKSCGF